MSGLNPALLRRVRRALAVHPVSRAELSSAIWAAFWLLILTAGEPDLLGTIVQVIGSWAS